MTEGTEPNRPRPRRDSRSDFAFPGVWVVGVLGVVVSLALLFVGYRVFDIESQRRSIQEDRAKLEGMDEAIAAARQASLKLSQLSVQVEASAQRLRDQEAQAARLEFRMQQQRDELDAGEKTLVKLREAREDESVRASDLLTKSNQLQLAIEQDRTIAADHESAKVSAESRRRLLEAEVEELSRKRVSLEREVAQLEGTRAGLKKSADVLLADERKIQEVGGKLEELFIALEAQGDGIRSSSDALAETVSQFQTSTLKELARQSKKLTESADAIDREVTSLHDSVRSFYDAETPLNEHLDRIAAASLSVDEATRGSLARLEATQRKLDDSAAMAAKAAGNLVPASDQLNRQVGELANELEDAGRRVGSASLTLDKTSSAFSRSITGRTKELDALEANLQRSVENLGRLLSDLAELRSAWEKQGSVPVVKSSAEPARTGSD